MPKASKVFQTKKVTKAEAKKVRPLTRYWAGRLTEARNSDNWSILAVGILIGAALVGILLS